MDDLFPVPHMPPQHVNSYEIQLYWLDMARAAIGCNYGAAMAVDLANTLVDGFNAKFPLEAPAYGGQ